MGESLVAHLFFARQLDIFAALPAIFDTLLVLGPCVFLGRSLRQAYAYYAHAAAADHSLCAGGQRVVSGNILFCHSILRYYAQDLAGDLSGRYGDFENKNRER